MTSGNLFTDLLDTDEIYANKIFCKNLSLLLNRKLLKIKGLRDRSDQLLRRAWRFRTPVKCQPQIADANRLKLPAKYTKPI